MKKREGGGHHHCDGSWRRRRRRRRRRVFFASNVGPPCDAFVDRIFQKYFSSNKCESPESPV
jgi:hypothetical protein